MTTFHNIPLAYPLPPFFFFSRIRTAMRELITLTLTLLISLTHYSQTEAELNYAKQLYESDKLLEAIEQLAVFSSDDLSSADGLTLEAVRHRAICQEASGQILSAIKTWTELSANENTAYEAFNMMGFLQSSEGNFESALSHFQETLNHGPADFYVWYNISQCQLQLSDHAAALSSIKLAIPLSPSEPERIQSQLIKADISLVTGDFSTALEDFKTTESLMSEDDELLIEVILSASFCEIQLNMFLNAIISAQKCLKINSQEWRAHFILGVARSNLGMDPCNDFNTAADLAAAELADNLQSGNSNPNSRLNSIAWDYLLPFEKLKEAGCE